MKCKTCGQHLPGTCANCGNPCKVKYCSGACKVAHHRNKAECKSIEKQLPKPIIEAASISKPYANHPQVIDYNPHVGITDETTFRGVNTGPSKKPHRCLLKE